jgi:hypothetical protein
MIDDNFDNSVITLKSHIRTRLRHVYNISLQCIIFRSVYLSSVKSITFEVSLFQFGLNISRLVQFVSFRSEYQLFRSVNSISVSVSVV